MISMKGGSPLEYCHDVWYVEKLEWFGYPIVKKIWRYCYWFWQNSRTWRTDRQTDTARRHRPHLHSMARQNQVIKLKINRRAFVLLFVYFVCFFYLIYNIFFAIFFAFLWIKLNIWGYCQVIGVRNWKAILSHSSSGLQLITHYQAYICLYM